MTPQYISPNGEPRAGALAEMLGNKNRALHIAVIVVIVALCYANSLTNRFNIDDPNLLIQNTAVHGFGGGNLKAMFTSVPNTAEYLPVRDLTYALDYELWGLNPVGYHLSNALYYALACVALYLMLELLLRGAHPRAALIALVTTAVFAVHPVHVEAVAGIAMRKDILAGLFAFASIWTYLLGRQRGRGYYFLSLMLYSLALLSKASPIVLPGVLLAIEVFFPLRASKGGVKGRMIWIGLFFIAGMGFFALHMTIAKLTAIISASASPLSARVPLSLGAVFYYIRLLFVPYPLTVWNEFGLSGPLPPLLVALAGVALASSLLLTLWFRRAVPILGFAWAWTLIFLLPVVGLAGGTTLIAERYLFIPSVGFALTLGWLAATPMNERRLRAAMAALAVVIVLFGGMTIDRNRDWRNTETLLLDGFQKNPESIKFTRMLGRYYFLNNRRDEAMRYFNDLKKLRPRDRNYEFHMAINLLDEGRPADALTLLDSMRLGTRGIVDVHYFYGKIYEALGRPGQARESYLRAMEGTSISGIYFKSDVATALRMLDASRAGH